MSLPEDLTEVLPEVAIGALGLVLIMMFFRGVETRWPENYFTIKDVLTYKISTSPIRYVLFRFGPVAVAGFFVGSLATAEQESAAASVSVMALAHMTMSSGQAIFKTLRQPKHEFARSVRLLVYAILCVGVLLAALIGWMLSRIEPLRDLLPRSTDVSLALWTAVIAGVIGAFLLAVSRGLAPSTEAVLNRSRSTLRDDMWEFMAVEARNQNADPALVQAVALVENLQRPPWIRALERAKGTFIRKGTYGLMQVTADEPISDQESVSRAINQWFRNTKRNGYVEDLEDLVNSYNPDPTFNDLVTDFYYHLAEEPDYEDEDDDVGYQEPGELSRRDLASMAGAAAIIGAVLGYAFARRATRTTHS